MILPNKKNDARCRGLLHLSAWNGGKVWTYIHSNVQVIIWTRKEVQAVAEQGLT